MPSGKTMKELLAERARIDAAMAQLDTAKMKASAQRAEYGRFLSWKVELQRKERKQREEESKQLRERVEKKLTEVLKEHREHKRQETHSYREFVASKVPKAQPLRLATSYDKEAEIVAEAQAERLRRKEEWEQFKVEMGYRPLRSQSSPQAAPPHDTSGKQQQGKRVGRNAAAVPQFVSATPRAAVPRTLDENAFDPEVVRDKVGQMDTLLRASRQFHSDEAEAISIAREARQRELNLTEKRHDAVKNRVDLMHSLYQKAKMRRMYAQNRIAADPPADYLIGTDILRYIPVDLIPGGGQFGHDDENPMKSHMGGDSNAFFMTAVDSSRADTHPPEAPGAALHPSPPGQSPDGSASPRGDGKRRKLTKAFDQQPWLRRDQLLLKGPLPELRQERSVEEEAAMYEWHKAQEASLHKRQPLWKTEKGYNWARREEGGIPSSAPPRSMKLDPL